MCNKGSVSFLLTVNRVTCISLGYTILNATLLGEERFIITCCQMVHLAPMDHGNPFLDIIFFTNETLNLLRDTKNTFIEIQKIRLFNDASISLANPILI